MVKPGGRTQIRNFPLPVNIGRNPHPRDRDVRWRVVEAADAQMLKHKIWVEQEKAQTEVDYLGRAHEVKIRLFDLETSRMVLEEEANMNRLGYRAGEIKARIAELTQQRDEIQQVNQEATDHSPADSPSLSASVAVEKMSVQVVGRTCATPEASCGPTNGHCVNGWGGKLRMEIVWLRRAKSRSLALTRQNRR